MRSTDNVWGVGTGVRDEEQVSKDGRERSEREWRSNGRGMKVNEWEEWKRRNEWGCETMRGWQMNGVKYEYNDAQNQTKKRG